MGALFHHPMSANAKLQKSTVCASEISCGGGLLAFRSVRSLAAVIEPPAARPANLRSPPPLRDPRRRRAIARIGARTAHHERGARECACTGSEADLRELTVSQLPTADSCNLLTPPPHYIAQFDGDRAS